MSITLKPEQERIIDEEIKSGHFHTPDEVLDQALAALREKGPSPRGRLFNSGHPRKTRAEAAEHIRQMRSGNRLPAGMTIRDLINEGRA